jgi:hypothetical protein
MVQMDSAQDWHRDMGMSECDQQPKHILCRVLERINDSFSRAQSSWLH